MDSQNKYSPQEERNGHSSPQGGSIPPHAPEAAPAAQPYAEAPESANPYPEPPQASNPYPEALSSANFYPESPQATNSYPETPFQVPVRFSQDAPHTYDNPVYHDEAHTGLASPFEPGTQSYATYQEWQTQRTGVRVKKPRSKKPFFALTSLVLAAALFFGGMHLGSLGKSANPSASSDANVPTIDISSPPEGGRPASADGVMTGEEIYDKLNPSVVAIQSVSGGNVQGGSSGSGVIMSADGFIITNAHVITDESTGVPMTNISVLFSDGTQLPAEVRGYDHQTDLAVIKVSPGSPLPPAEFGNSDALFVGEAAYAIGSPGGVQLANTMTNGIISAINRNITVNDRVMSLIQTNVTINPGNSGGALINQYGQVVGITSAKLGISYYEGLGFAIPINSAKEVVDQLIANGYIPGRPSIGIMGSDISAQAAQYRNLPQGVEVASVDSRAHAASEGLMAGDIITGVEGTPITTMNEVNSIKNDLKAGDAIVLTLYRPSLQQSFDLRITLTDTHDLEGTDPARQQEQQYEAPQSPGSGGYFDPFQYFFGY